MPSTDRQHAFLAGVRACIPLAPGVLLFGMVCGAAAAAAGLTPGQSFALSWLVFAGSSQIVATQLFVADAPGWVIVLTGWIVRLRFMLYSATLAQQFRGRTHYYAPEARGWVRPGRLLLWRFDAELFPDLAGSAVVAALRVESFRMTFPVARVD